MPWTWKSRERNSVLKSTSFPDSYGRAHPEALASGSGRIIYSETIGTATCKVFSVPTSEWDIDCVPLWPLAEVANKKSPDLWAEKWKHRNAARSVVFSSHPRRDLPSSKQNGQWTWETCVPTCVRRGMQIYSLIEGGRGVLAKNTLKPENRWQIAWKSRREQKAHQESIKKLNFPTQIWTARAKLFKHEKLSSSRLLNFGFKWDTKSL